MLWLLSGCAGDGPELRSIEGDAGGPTDAGPGTDAGSPGCEAVMHQVWLTCGAIVCHDPFSGGIGTFLDLSMPAALPESLRGLTSSSECGGVPYVDPDQPANSLLLRKLDDDPPCGERMPAGDRPPLDDRERECFTQWVRRAAAALAQASP